MKRYSWILCLFLIGFGACSSGHHGARLQEPFAPPSAPPVQNAAATGVDKVVAEARQHYFVGERELSLGHLEKAKDEFNASLDVLMEYQGKHDPDSRVQAVVDELQDKIFAHEMAALKEGDGFTEHPLEPALIDDLKNIDTFPTPDQQTKNEVEQELKNSTYTVPIEVNDTVLSFIRIFQNSRRNEMAGGLIRSGRYLDTMKQIFREEGVPEDLVYTALIESSFKPNAYSRARAKGFWQFISGTAKRYDLQMDWWIDERSDFEASTRAAAHYLRDLHGMFNDWYLALAGYNAGENKILYGLERTGASSFWELASTRYLNQETKNYVPAIIASIIIAKDPQKYGFDDQTSDPIQYEKVEIDYPVDLRLVAECTGRSMEEIKLLNSGLNRSTTPARGTYDLKLPAGTRDTFLAEIASVPEDKRITWRKHEVKEGDTLTSIAGLYHAPVASIAAVNSFDPNAPLSIGQKLVIPIGRESSTSAYSASNTYTRVSGDRKYYAVNRGDTLFKIAQSHNTTVDQLCAWNRIPKGHTLHVGESLVVRLVSPSTTTTTSDGKAIVYHVKRGDTLTQIANNYKTDVESLKRWNHISDGSVLNVGDRLTIIRK